MNSIIQDFALQLLRRLQKRPSKDDGANGAGVKSEGDDDNMEDGQMPDEELVSTPYLPETIELPAQQAVVTQHVELVFGLTVKVPDLLEE